MGGKGCTVSGRAAEVLWHPVWCWPGQGARVERGQGWLGCEAEWRACQRWYTQHDGIRLVSRSMC